MRPNYKNIYKSDLFPKTFCQTRYAENVGYSERVLKALKLANGEEKHPEKTSKC